MLQGTVTSADGTVIAYTAWGDGDPTAPTAPIDPIDPIVLVDGATAHRATTPENAQTAELLARDFRVINYDRRGRGESGDTAPYAVEREFEDLAATIEGPGGGRPATVFGWSSGGHLALNAAQAGAPIKRLVLFEPPVVVDDGRPPLPHDYVERLDAAIAAGRPGDAVELFMSAAAGVPEEAVADMRESDFWPALEAVAPTIAYDGRNVGDTMSGKPLRGDLWDKISVPVLVLHGQDTWPFLAAGAKAVADHLPTATLKAIPGESHSTTAAALAPVLEAFAKGS